MLLSAMQNSETKLCPRALLVDDSPFVRKTLCAMLRAWNIECVKAGNGNSGFEQMLSIRPDLVITDLYMPECDGFELLNRIANLPVDERPPVTRSLPGTPLAYPGAGRVSRKLDPGLSVGKPGLAGG